MADLKPAAAANSAEQKPTSVAELTTAFPDLVASIRTEAATAERARIQGIEKAAGKRRGLDDLVARMKADASCSPDKAAMQILEHENAQLEARGTDLKGVETEGGKIAPAPNSGGALDAPKVVQQNAEGWKAEWAASAVLQSEFTSAEQYASFKDGEASGRIRILKTKSA